MGKKAKKDAGPPKPKVPVETLTDVAILTDDAAPVEEKANSAFRLGAFASAADVQRSDLGATGAIEALTQALKQLAEPLPRNLRPTTGSKTGSGSLSKHAASVVAAQLRFAEQAMSALRALCANNPLSTAYCNAGKIIDAGGAAILVEWLRPPAAGVKHRMPASDALREQAVACLCNLTKKHRFREAIVDCRAVEPLVAIAGNQDGRSTARMRRDAVFCLGGLSFCHEANKAALIEAGAVPVLQAILDGGTAASPPTTSEDAQLQQVAAYALKNVLEPPRVLAEPTAAAESTMKKK